MRTLAVSIAIVFLVCIPAHAFFGNGMATAHHSGEHQSQDLSAAFDLHDHAMAMGSALLVDFIWTIALAAIVFWLGLLVAPAIVSVFKRFLLWNRLVCAAHRDMLSWLLFHVTSPPRATITVSLSD